MAVTPAIENPDAAFIPFETLVYSCPLDAVVEYGVDADFPTGTVFHGIIKDSSPIKLSLSISIKDHKGAAGGRIYRKTVDSSDAVFTVGFVESSTANYTLFSGKTKNIDTGGYHIDPGFLGGHRQFFFVGKDTSTGARMKLWAPDAQVTDRGERTFTFDEVTGFDLTISTFSTLVEGERANVVEWYSATAAVAS